MFFILIRMVWNERTYYWTQPIITITKTTSAAIVLLKI